MIKNCINCGAVLVNKKCEYCGTEYNERFSTNMSDDLRGTLTYKGKTFDVYMSEVEVRHLGFDSYIDSDGKISRASNGTKRTFTLIEY